MGLCFARADAADYFWIGYFFVLNGTSSFGMKYIVLVPSICLLTPWYKRPDSLAKDLVHISLSGPLMRW